ncbi:MAG TPA: L-serine ammonia-lyase, iron-sulfur-dependent, subunit beta [Candidatus Merdenecus merdavium]|nr:L-serine ammonia-lyase, iron-sulfur-dependent, subunit beta [Candidatus Merdenecus merdavium]
MKFKSAFDIIGPIMVGPSSSHTAGAVRIGQIARRIFRREPEEIDVYFFGSFATTYKGHATDVAVIGGVMDYETDDDRIPRAIEIAKESGIKVSFHVEEAIPKFPNTVKIILKKGKHTLDITGISIGGGAVEITELNGFELKLSGESPAMLILHRDAYGTIATVANILARHEINISHMEVSRLEKGHTALMVIESDQMIHQEIIDEISMGHNIQDVTILKE